MTDLVVRPGQVPMVEGVVTGAGDTIRAGLVVDAGGRRSRLSAMLEAHGVSLVTSLPVQLYPHAPGCTLVAHRSPDPRVCCRT